MENTQTKTCPKCGRTLPIENFYVCKDGKPYSYCKECLKTYNKERSMRITPPIRKIPSRHTLRDSSCRS